MYTLGYDLGSSSIKVAIVEVDTAKKVASLHEPPDEMSIVALQHDWAEQDPDQWWKFVCIATRRILKESNIDASKITAIGISYQMHGLVLVDKDGHSLRDAIIWCDSRAVSIGKKAYKDLGHEFCATKLLNTPGNFTASKLKWVLDNQPALYGQIHKYMLPGDYIAYKLTGELVTTRNGLAEGTLWNYKTNKVAHELLDYYGLDQSLTPNIVDNFTNQGEVHSTAAIETGLVQGIPVTYRSGDQPNNALSLNVFKPGEVAATGGTSGVIYAVTDQKEFKEIRKVNHFAHVNYTEKKPTVGRLLNINGAGIQYKWLRDNSVEDSYESMNHKASKLPIGSDGVKVFPFGNGAERMFNNLNIGTHFCNLNLNKHSNAHIFRAALEGIAFSFVYGMGILKSDSTVIHTIRAGNDNLFRSEIFTNTIATLIGHEIEIYDTTGAVGAARAAGLTDMDFDRFGSNITKNDHVTTYQPIENKQPYREAYDRWKLQLDIIMQNYN